MSRPHLSWDVETKFSNQNALLFISKMACLKHFHEKSQVGRGGLWKGTRTNVKALESSMGSLHGAVMALGERDSVTSLLCPSESSREKKHWHHIILWVFSGQKLCCYVIYWKYGFYSSRMITRLFHFWWDTPPMIVYSNQMCVQPLFILGGSGNKS